MARRFDKLRVARASLYGAEQRLVDLERRRDLTSEQRAEHQAEALETIQKARATITALGGDPDTGISQTR